MVGIIDQNGLDFKIKSAGRRQRVSSKGLILLTLR
jgi:hypothetical protein